MNLLLLRRGRKTRTPNAAGVDKEPEPARPPSPRPIFGDIHSSRVPWPLSLPTAALLMLGLVLPLALIFFDSFRLRGVHGGFAPIEDLWLHLSSGAFLANYEKALQPIYLSIFWRSLWIAGLTTLLCLLVGYPLAYWLALRVPSKLRPLGLLLVVIPFWTSFVVRTFAWVWILRTEGLINNAALSLGLISEPLQLLYTEPAVLMGLIYGELPFMILPIYASLERLDRALLEAAADLGANPATTFVRVTWPLTLPGVLAGIVLVFVPSVGQYLISDMLGGARSMLVGNLIQNQFFGGKNQPFGFAVAFLLTALVLSLLWGYTRVGNTSTEDLL
jgi:spermidine/putrescine transport system permease protein